MAVADDWDIDYVNTEIRHVDGVLSYDTNTGTAPALNDYVIGGTSGAVGRIIAGSDLGGVGATGTLTLTNVVGRFADNETLRVLSTVDFDTVANGGFKVGDTITGPTTESIDVKAIEYNSNGRAAGKGTIFGNNLTAGFADGEQLDISGGQTAVALVDVGAETDNSALFATCLVNGPLAVPGTANTNNSEIIHFDAGSSALPVLPIGTQVGSDTTTATGKVQQTVGTSVTGSLRLIDSNTSGGAWTDGHGLEIEEIVFWNAQVAGEVFQTGSVYEGQTSGNRFRVLGIIDDGDNTGKLITASKQGAMTLNEDIHIINPGDVLGQKIAQVESTTTVLAYATLDIVGGTLKEQRSAAGVSQGGIYGSAATPVSLNIRRDSNEFFSYIKTTFALNQQLNDKPAINGNVKDSLYTVLSSNGWEIPDLSFRFLERGAWKDEGNNNVWTNYTAGEDTFTGIDFTANGYQQKAANPRPMPDAYCEQYPGEKVDTFWLNGPFDAIIKVKTTTDVRVIVDATPSLGQLINAGAVVWHSRPYGRLYSFFDNSKVGTVSVIVLANKDDPDNNTGQYRYSFNTGGAGAFTVGEEIATSDGTKVGIVTASDSGATGNVDYVLRSDTQFADTNVITGVVSGKSATLDGAGLSNLVAGYGTDIRTMVVDRRFTGGTTTVATFIIGEQVSQAVSGYDGYVLEDDGGTIYVQDAPGTAAPNGTGQLSGDTSGALNTPTAVADFTTVPKDLGEGSGDNNYAGVTSGDITGANARTAAELYEWDKFLTAETYKTTLLQGGRGNAAGVEGRFYRGFDSTFSEEPTAPYGTIAGGILFAAEGHFIDKDTLVVADIQKMRLLPIGAATRLVPPNLQIAEITNVGNGWGVAIYPSTGAGSKTIRVTEFQVGAGNAAVNSVIVLQSGDRAVPITTADVPIIGVLECEDPNLPGNYLLFPYNARVLSTGTFTLTSGTIGDVTGGAALIQGDNAYVAWLDKIATGTPVQVTNQFVATFNLVAVARKKGFDDSEQAGQFSATGVSFAVNQIADSVVNLP